MENIEKIIGYTFKNKDLLTVALTHSSYANKNNIKSNERLEFLGDSIIGFLVANYLIKEFDYNEGNLTKIRARIVSCENLSKIVSKYKLDEHIKVFPANINKSEAIKGDFFEALLGAIYLDGGLINAEEFVFKFVDLSKDFINDLCSNTNDYKTQLQEIVQANKGTIEYRLVSQEGMPNDMTFEFELFINNKLISKAKEKSKQKAENLCAKLAIKNIANLFD